ncbi:phage tail protein [Enterobacter sichuanensis]|uniref:phage tail-collar fiber domain-containing protein n=1 Tax=Enterobacter sichuanensis TaxID=2071710 RepID=UPI002DBFADED|nr:phage tail protein [Enterobacter sichuanensis]MEB5958808.1 phage tail protein [Enterobacter sichuanensis]
MKSTVTDAFIEWNVNKILAGEPATPDQIIFALIPGQDAQEDIDPAEGMPGASEIVYKSGFTRMARLNENAVVYSLVLDTTIGDWSYNWVGIADSATGTVLMIVHCDEQKKIKTAAGVQGNNLIRNMVMEFAGAAEATQITVTPETWQIDYSARHAGSDERVRAENIDVYGIAAFEGDGFMVTSAGGKFQVAPGLGYIHGLRCYSEAAASPGAIANSTKVWVDATWQGTPTGAWSVTYSLRLVPELENYEKDGFQHYVFAIAETDAAGNITDLRPPFPLDRIAQDFDGQFLRIEQNLADVKDKAKGRQNLGLKGAAVLDVGTTAGTVAAGDDSRITGALQKNQNLADVSDKAKGRQNLGLKGAAVLDIGTTAGTVAAGDDSRITGALQKAQDLADVSDKAKGRQNLGLKGAAVLDVGTTAGTVAAGNDSRITGALQSEKLLSEIAARGATAQATARTNLGINDVGSIPGAGQVGSHILARWQGGGASGRSKLRYGDTIAGSVLASTGLIDRSTSESDVKLAFYSNDFFANDISGTWRCLGQMSKDDATGTLFVRIA